MADTTRNLARVEPGLPRGVLAWVAVMATLLAAVLAARGGSTSPVALAVATLAGDAAWGDADRPARH
jgi:hypothetical protein